MTADRKGALPARPNRRLNCPTPSKWPSSADPDSFDGHRLSAHSIPTSQILRTKRLEASGTRGASFPLRLPCPPTRFLLGHSHSGTLSRPTLPVLLDRLNEDLRTNLSHTPKSTRRGFHQRDVKVFKHNRYLRQPPLRFPHPPTCPPAPYSDIHSAPVRSIDLKD